MEKSKKLKIFATPWHIAHQFSLFTALEKYADFYMIVNSVRKWGENAYRPIPKNTFLVPYYEPGKYDLAIINVDQQCVDETLGKSRLYRNLNDEIKDIPKIVINHGTPFWPELYDSEYLIMRMKMMIGDNHMVVNSDRAREMWGDMGKSTTTIIHGIDDEGWMDLPKEPRVVTSLSPAGLDRYYNRQLMLEVRDRLKERGIPHVWISVDFVAKSFEDYKNFLGRSLIYFNPTVESPMPRSRTEAMLSGCCTITLANHGAEKFIKSGENGFLVPNNPEPIVELITEMMYGDYYSMCVDIGRRGKETAQKLFSKERYRNDWLALLEKVLNRKICQ